MQSLSSVVLLALVLVQCASADYWEERAKFLAEEQAMFLGSQLRLAGKEIIVNNILMEAKNKEYLKSFQSEKTTFPPARHFFEAKADIELSEVFKIIQVMPKGGALHGHDFALASTDYLIKNLTYRDNLYGCTDRDDFFLLHFFLTPDASCNWTSISDMRRQSGDIQAFDKWLKLKLSLVVDNPGETYSDVNAVWKAFEAIFHAINGLITFRPVFQDYIYQFLTEFNEDKVMYIEFRSVMPQIYDLEGTEYNIVDTARIFNSVVEKFVRENLDFLGGKVIFAPFRRVNNATIGNYLEEYRAMKRVLPHFVAGFDLVGQEDKGEPLVAFIDKLQEFLQDGTHFFFHAGETDWLGTSTDENLIDAILLNSTRIGHGFAVTKHPHAMKLIKERGIAIEVNPISNQVLMLVQDLRNHPAAMLMADNYPLVIGSDDPSFWGAKGLSYDMYEAFMGFGGLHADLRTLKQLAINSLVFSAMPAGEKANAIKVWESRWDSFLSLVIDRQEEREKVKPALFSRLTSLGADRVVRV